MGALYWYYCRKCKFKIQSEGETWWTMFSRGKCFKCLDCDTVADLATQEDGSGAEEWKDVTPVCWKCNSTNVIEWDFKCPKCNIKISRKRHPHIYED